jgi:ribosomal protein S18 acetylase RimI-like enzyme
MLIRKLVSTDIPAVLALAAREEGFKVSKDAPYFWSPVQLESWIEAGEDVLLAAVDDGVLVGFVLTTFHRPTGKVTWENQLVHPVYRQRGVGAALIYEMRKRLKEEGAKYLCAYVKTDNLDSLNYYVKLGLTRGYDFAWLEDNL